MVPKFKTQFRFFIWTFLFYIECNVIRLHEVFWTHPDAHQLASIGRCEGKSHHKKYNCNQVMAYKLNRWWENVHQDAHQFTIKKREKKYICTPIHKQEGIRATHEGSGTGEISPQKYDCSQVNELRKQMLAQLLQPICTCIRTRPHSDACQFKGG